MNNIGPFYFKKVGTLKPTFFRIGAHSHTMNVAGVYMSYTNWSNQYRTGMFAVTEGRVIGFRSGRGSFIANGALLVDTVSGDILTIMVRNSAGNLLYLVSDKLDTPKCIRRYKSFRSHWRKGLFERYERHLLALELGVKIVKTKHDFLQKFMLKFNSVPTASQMITIRSKIDLGVSALA